MTVVVDQSTALAGTDDGDGNGNANFRQLINTAALGAATGTQVRVTVLFGTAEGSESPAIDDMWIGQKAAAGNPYDFNGNQVQVKFGGGSSINGSAAGVVVSDFVTLGEAYDNTKSYIIAFHATNGKNANISLATISQFTQYFIGGASNSSTTAPSGIWSTNVNNLGFIEKIEIQAAGGEVLQGAQQRFYM